MPDNVKVTAAADHKQANGNAKKQKAEKPQAPQKTKAIFVEGLPLDADEEEVEHVFKRCGLIAESAETNTPRIKLYKDEHGNFKGQALIGTCPYVPRTTDVAHHRSSLPPR